VIASLTAAGASLLLLVACSSAGSGGPDVAAELLGTSLESARTAFPEDAAVYIQDASPVVGLEATYREGLSDDTWTVVSACSSEERIPKSDLVEVAVVPTASFTEAVEERMKDGEFRDAVTSCQG
jgi:hypothetical protein